MVGAALIRPAKADRSKYEKPPAERGVRFDIN
jgi:hypothetical protein